MEKREIILSDEDKLYMEQIALWFTEQDKLASELARAVKHYNELAELNKKQLELHNRRTELGSKEFGEWMKSKGLVV